MGLTSEFQQTSVMYVSKLCNLVNAAVSSKDNKCSAEQTIDKLLKNAESKAQEKTPEKPQPVEPNQTQ